MSSEDSNLIVQSENLLYEAGMLPAHQAFEMLTKARSVRERVSQRLGEGESPLLLPYNMMPFTSACSYAVRVTLPSLYASYLELRARRLFVQHEEGI